MIRAFILSALATLGFALFANAIVAGFVQCEAARSCPQ